MPNLHTVLLPDIGEGVVEGEIIKWLKHEGDVVEQDEAVVVVMTDKATVDLSAPYPGMLVKQYYEVGQIAYKDKPLYDIQLSSDISTSISVLSADKAEKIVKYSHTPKQPLVSQKSPIQRQYSSQNVLATPKVRGLAKAMNIDLHKIQDTGPQGRIEQVDLQNYVQRTESSYIERPSILVHSDDTVEPLQGVRRLIAQKMTVAKSIIPHCSFFDEVDMTEFIKRSKPLKQQFKDKNLRLTYMPLFIYALSACLKKFPAFNASLDMEKQQIIYRFAHNIGFAVQAEQGLVVPVLKNAQDHSLFSLTQEYERLKVAARDNKIDPKDMKDSTITFSNFGTEGGLFATPIINYPEVAILGVAAIRDKAVVREGQIVIRSIMALSWSFDHRLIDGAQMAACSNEYKKQLEDGFNITH